MTASIRTCPRLNMSVFVYVSLLAFSTADSAVAVVQWVVAVAQVAEGSELLSFAFYLFL